MCTYHILPSAELFNQMQCSIYTTRVEKENKSSFLIFMSNAWGACGIYAFFSRRTPIMLYREQQQQQLFKYKRICIGESRPPSDEPPPYTSVRGEKTCWWKIKTDNHNTKFHSFLFYATAVYYRRCKLVGYIGGEGITI